jgi:hypothetical protein
LLTLDLLDLLLLSSSLLPLVVRLRFGDQQGLLLSMVGLAANDVLVEPRVDGRVCGPVSEPQSRGQLAVASWRPRSPSCPDATRQLSPSPCNTYDARLASRSGHMKQKGWSTTSNLCLAASRRYNSDFFFDHRLQM